MRRSQVENQLQRRQRIRRRYEAFKKPTPTISDRLPALLRLFATELLIRALARKHHRTLYNLSGHRAGCLNITYCK